MPTKKSNPTRKNSKKSNNVVELKPKQVKCEFCNKFFLSEEIEDHSCLKKKRLKSREKKEFIVAYQVYKIYKEFNSYGKKKETTITEFVKFRYYNTFIKFGVFMVKLGPRELAQYTRYLCKECVAFADWRKLDTYNNWLIKRNAAEDVISASERGIKLMMEWEQTTERGEWFDFFRLVNTELAIEFIFAGRLSPWLLFSGLANSLLERMSEEQLVKIADNLDVIYWQKEITENFDELEYVKKVYKEFNIV